MPLPKLGSVSPKADQRQPSPEVDSAGWVRVAPALPVGARRRVVLGRLKGWMRRNDAVILAVVLLVIGVTLIGDGIGGLPS